MILQCIRLFIVLTILCGAIYPAAVTVVGYGLFPNEANGSIISRDGKQVASELIGQNFTSQRYFWGRPSATGPVPYNGAASSGSNLAQNNPTLLTNMRSRIEALGVSTESSKVLPTDLITASGSGLDPHISPAAALVQIDRVATARGLSRQAVEQLVNEQTETRFIGLLGEPRVNVVLLNLALDSIK